MLKRALEGLVLDHLDELHLLILRVAFKWEGGWLNKFGLDFSSFILEFTSRRGGGGFDLQVKFLFSALKSFSVGESILGKIYHFFILEG